jgi:hypothetical protein
MMAARAMFSLKVEVAVKVFTPSGPNLVNGGVDTDCSEIDEEVFCPQCPLRGEHPLDAAAPAQPVRLEDELPVAQVKLVGHVPG